MRLKLDRLRSIFLWCEHWKPRGNTWGYEETVSLSEVWAEDTMQRDLENTPKRNMDTYKKIVEQINAQMRENGHSFKRTPVECRSRVKRLKTQYFKTKEVNKKSGSRRTSFPYYHNFVHMLAFVSIQTNIYDPIQAMTMQKMSYRARIFNILWKEKRGILNISRQRKWTKSQGVDGPVSRTTSGWTAF
jgi:hypothetical protein